MELTEVIRRRHMVRTYTDEPVDPVVIERMLAHAVRAPSAGFSQGWGFLVLDSADDVARFWSVTSPDGDADNDWITGMRAAPVVIVPLSNKSAYLDRYAEPDKGWPDRDESRWPVPYWHIDTGMASLLILLTAVDAGLGACFFGIPATHTDSFRSEFGVPAEYTPIGAISIGHAAPVDPVTGSRSRGRKPIEDVVHRGQW